MWRPDPHVFQSFNEDGLYPFGKVIEKDKGVLSDKSCKNNAVSW